MQLSEAVQLQETVQVTVKLFATFRAGRFAVAEREYAPGTRIAEVVSELQIPEAQIGTIMLNHRHAEPHQELHDGDKLSIFPLVGGG